MKTHRWFVVLVAACSTAVTPAVADLVGVQMSGATPDLSLYGHTMVPFTADTAAVGAVVTAVSLPTGATPSGSLLFDAGLTHLTIGNGWGTWIDGYAGDVYWLDELGSGRNTITLIPPSDTKAFSFALEPGFFGQFDFTVTVFSTAGEWVGFSPSIYGNGGATGFGFFTEGPTNASLASIEITGLNTWPDGFAIGEFAINGSSGSVPGTPDGGHTAALLGAALVTLAIGRRRFRR